ncbi:hypothetical protein [Mycobacterium sp. E342]|uniref:hypothetical protein n=1 Tax=Mycobacterium sp. E342 TaxID=1834147 RepID=UPI000AB09E63|nr:hypothetical protein [Mycobacterium sp. E342]
MRWYARPENDALQLRVAPRLASWNKADHPDQVRLRAYLDDAEALLATSRIAGPWALRLDVGLPAARDLLDAADLDNYAYPLAYRLRNLDLVSVWCTKQHNERSLVRIEAAHEVSPPSTDVLIVKTTGSASTAAFKEQIRASVVDATELPAGPVRLELSFTVGARRNWLNLWKPTIDSLDPILGRTYPDHAWHPRDGRITELGMHVCVDPAAGNEIVVGIAAAQGRTDVIPPQRLNDPAVSQDSMSDASRSPAGEPVDQESSREAEIGVLSPTPVEFRDDDTGYLTWLTGHPNGYVINIARNYSASAARVHHAGCRTISGQNPHKGAWTGPYVKICAAQLADLERWAANNVREPIPPCGTCRPKRRDR